MRRHPADSTNRSLAAFEKLQHILSKPSKKQQVYRHDSSNRIPCLA